jgi:hypothetical protein
LANVASSLHGLAYEPELTVASGVAEGKIPVEYEQEIRRMLKLDDASRSQSTAHSPRLSTTHMSSPGQSARSVPTTPVPLKAGTGNAFGEETSARVSLPGAWLVQGFKAVLGRLVESEKLAYQLKAGVAVLVLAILLLLQVSHLADPDWSNNDDISGHLSYRGTLFLLLDGGQQ